MCGVGVLDGLYIYIYVVYPTILPIYVCTYIQCSRDHQELQCDVFNGSDSASQTKHSITSVNQVALALLTPPSSNSNSSSPINACGGGSSGGGTSFFNEKLVALIRETASKTTAIQRVQGYRVRLECILQNSDNDSVCLECVV